MMTRKTKKNNILVYALKSDDNQKAKSVSWVYALKSDDSPKPTNRYSKAYALKSDDGGKDNTETWKKIITVILSGGSDPHGIQSLKNQKS